MLKRLCIRNFAIIESVDLTLQSGFIALTGETGAGKSIVFDALQLVLGGRATVDMVRYNTPQAEVEGTLCLSESQSRRINSILAVNGCPEDDELVVKRIITSGGRNRIFINGSRSTLQLLQQVTKGLVDVMGQNESHKLLDSSAHLPMVDSFCHSQLESQLIAKKVKKLNGLQKEHQQLVKEDEIRQSQIHSLQCQFDEINSAELCEGEDEKLEAKLTRIFASEELRERSIGALQMLQDQDNSVMDLIGTISDSLKRVSDSSPEMDNILGPLVNTQIQIAEICLDLRKFADLEDVDPTSVEELQDRLELIRRLKRHHGGSITNVFEVATKFQSELIDLKLQNLRVDDLKTEMLLLEKELMIDCIQLSHKRQEGALKMANIIESELRELSMPHCRFRAHFSFKGENGQMVQSVENCHPSMLSLTGLDSLSFEISPNPGEGFKPLVRVASGGELSRILLSIKGAMIQTDPVSTYLFDEVDSGIGGGVAETVGRKLQRVGDIRQVICITHLPQVACCAHQHIKIKKEVHENRTHSTLKHLVFSERVHEISRMLGGAELTDMTIAHAKELMMLNQPKPCLRLVEQAV
jgi:DNA repair protein RecN (Recombination protein N)